MPDEALKWATRSHDLCAERCQSGVTVFTSALSLIWQRENKYKPREGGREGGMEGQIDSRERLHGVPVGDELERGLEGVGSVVAFLVCGGRRMRRGEKKQQQKNQ